MVKILSNINEENTNFPNLSLIEEFHKTWDTYPEPSLLIHKSRTIIAVNEACLKGGSKPGMKCSEWGSPHWHKRCLANRALIEGVALFTESVTKTGIKRFVWVPLYEETDYYLHFTVIIKKI